MDMLRCIVCSVFCVLNFPICARLAPVAEFDIWSDNNSISTPSFEGNINLSDRKPKVLNFFPIPVEEECLSTDGRRKGICMNTYECRIQGGSSHGFCAMGFGVCCVFTATCDQDIYNNITHFVNPHFPDLDEDMTGCNIKVRKIDEEISQIRLDFIHFQLGQPNRKTGICEDDVLTITGGSAKDLSMCGFNSGQHVYYDVENVDEAINIYMNLSKKTAKRFWEIRVTQIPFSQRAPVGCLQYHTGKSGVVQTMNFAENGRHLANQDYNICMRQERRMCSIAYEPCDENSFRIASNAVLDDPQGAVIQMQMILQNPNAQASSASPTSGASNDQGANNEQTVANDQESSDTNTIEGSGEPIAEEGRSVEVCADRIVMPCDSEDFVMPGDTSPEFCSIARCGSSLCPDGESPCRIESSVTPFSIGVHFGPSSRDNSPPDENLGMCLVYKQVPCNI